MEAKRIFGWGVLSQIGAFVMERFRGSLIRIISFGISVCQIARRHSHLCVTIRGQLRLLVASGSWKKTKTPD